MPFWKKKPTDNALSNPGSNSLVDRLTEGYGEAARKPLSKKLLQAPQDEPKLLTDGKSDKNNKLFSRYWMQTQQKEVKDIIENKVETITVENLVEMLKAMGFAKNSVEINVWILEQATHNYKFFKKFKDAIEEIENSDKAYLIPYIIAAAVFPAPYERARNYLNSLFTDKKSWAEAVNLPGNDGKMMIKDYINKRLHEE